MSFVKLFSVISSLFCDQTFSPSGNFFWLTISNLLASVGQFICSCFYWVCKWLLALVDFLQYFIQKLIGLDYWLKAGKKTWSGAIKNDILFSFLYNDTVQRVFRAMVGVFVVLLIVFTIFSIIRQEWQYITGESKKGGSFGDGKGNSKASIIRDALKAIALVLIFPMILMVGIISSNAILASLVKALNIDMATTFGGSLFSISAQSANKYRLYASSGNRMAASSKITFYEKNGLIMVYSGTGTNKDDTKYETFYNDYALYLKDIKTAKKHVVDSMFKTIVPSDYGDGHLFSGYCISITEDDEKKWYMVYCSDEEKDSMRLYLNGILKVNVLTPLNNGNNAITKVAKPDSTGFISRLNLENRPKGDLITACYNTWFYQTIYNQSKTFNESLSYDVFDSSILNTKYNIKGISNAKMLYNSNQISAYFDGGQFGFVQTQSEYYVMSDVVDFMNDKQVKLYMVDITSDIISWNYTDDLNSNYQVDTKWLCDNAITMSDDNGNYDKYKTFITAYSEECPDIESGNVINFAKYGTSNELQGSKYIMCWKVTQDDKSVFIPLVNGKTFRDPETTQSYTFKSDYYESSYKGVVIAKGVLDASGSSTNTRLGEPTYIQSDVYFTDKNGNTSSAVSTDKPYYYQLVKTGYLRQYADDKATEEGNEYSEVESIMLDSAYSSNGYSCSINTADGNAGTTDKIIQLIKDSEKQSFNDDMVQTLTLKFRNKSNGISTAEYAGVKQTLENSTKTQYIFCTNDDSYIIVELDVGVLRIKGVYADGKINGEGQSKNIKSVQKKYTLKYTYAGKTGDIIDLTPNYFEYSSIKDDYSMFQTTERQYIQIKDDSNTLIDKTMYINAYFKTTETHLYSINDGKITFAEALGDTTSTAGKKNLTQETTFFTAYLYNFLTGYVNGNLYEYKIDSKTTESVSTPTDDEFITTFNMNSNGFSWDKTSDVVGLYDGKNYVASLYKRTGSDDSYGLSADSDNSALETFFTNKSTRILIDGNEYYNIQNQNSFTSVDALKTNYDKSLDSLRIGFYRDNLSDFSFLRIDFNFSLVGNFRFHWGWFLRTVDTVSSKSFELYDGITFDYFFDSDNVDLSTFYIPSKISYWIILIACALIIKVLGTALWGVIKRFYEITMYFIAMPAVASTIPLDGGSKFNKSIKTPLISKVLSTYGVILGINVFFILLAPVKSISQIFTAQDIAESGSYFLKHLPIPVRWLNNYVYILFVLVAFTMIEDLPKTISQIVGGDDIVASGNTTKGAVNKNLKEAGDIISGRSAYKKIKETGELVAGSIPGNEFVRRGLGKVKSDIGGFFDRHRDKKDTADGAESGGSSRSSEGGQGGTDGSGGDAGENGGAGGSGGAETNNAGGEKGREGQSAPAETNPLDQDAMENAAMTAATEATSKGTGGAEANNAGGGATHSGGALSGVFEGAGGKKGQEGETETKGGKTGTENSGEKTQESSDGTVDVDLPTEAGEEGKSVDGTKENAVTGKPDETDKTDENGKKNPNKPKSFMDEVREKSDKQVGFIKALPGTIKKATEKFGGFLTTPFVAAGKGISFIGKKVGQGIAIGASFVGNTTKKVVKASGEFLAKAGKVLATPFVAVGKGVGSVGKKIGQGIAKGASFVGRKVKTGAQATGNFVKKLGTSFTDKTKAFVNRHEKLKSFLTTTAATGMTIYRGASWLGKKTAKAAHNVGEKLANTKVGKAITSGAMTIKDKTSAFAGRIADALNPVSFIKTSRRRAVEGPIETGDETIPVNSHNGIHFSSSLSGRGATGEGKTSGQIIAKAIEEGTTLSEGQVEKITVSEFNEKATSDKEFIDNKDEARANVIKNQVGTKIGKMVTTEVLSTYASKIDPNTTKDTSIAQRVAKAIGGTDGKNGLLTKEMRTELVKSVMTKEEVVKFEQANDSERAGILAKYQAGASIGANGAIGFSVSKDDKKIKVDQNTTDEIVSKMIDAIGDEAIVTAINKTGAIENVDMALASNIANGINFTTQNSSTTTSLMANAVFEKATQDDDIVADAMLRHIESSKTTNPSLYQRFQDEFNIGEADLNNGAIRKRVLEQIKMFNKSDNANIINTMNKDDYANEFTGIVQEKVKNGSFKVTAWDLADDDTKAEFSAKTKTNLEHVTDGSILDGATDSQKVNIIANTATNLMKQKGDTAESKKIQSAAFIKNVSNAELRSMEPETLSKLVGRNVEAEDLTADDKAFLGFVKARNGGTLSGVNSDAVSVNKFKNDFANGTARFNAFNSLSNKIKYNAVSANNKTEVYGAIASQDATYAMTKESLNRAEVSYIKTMGEGSAKNELNRMYAEFTGRKDVDISTANQASVKKFLASSSKATNLVASSMRESGYDFRAVVNPNYEPTYTRTEAEKRVEARLSVDAVKKSAPTSVYNAFIASDVENKGVIADEMFAQFAGIKDVNSAGYKEALASIKNGGVDVDGLIMNGHSEANIVMAYKKAQMLGAIGKNGEGLSAESIEEYLSPTSAQSEMILKKMQNMLESDRQSLFAGGDSYLKVANTLMTDRLTSEQNEELINIAAKNGFSGMSEKEQNQIVVKMAMKDGQILQNASKNGAPATEDDVREYLMSNAGKEDRERMQAKASMKSYYELDQAVNNDMSAGDAYKRIKAEVKKNQDIEEIYASQGSLIDNDTMRNGILSSNDTVAADYVASSYANKINTISKSEEQQIRINAEFNALDKNIVSDIESTKEKSLDSAQTRALYTEFSSNKKYSSRVAAIRKSSEYKQRSKEEGFNAENYIVSQMRDELTSDSAYGKENAKLIARIEGNARKQAIIAEAISRDESLGIELEAIGSSAVELKNRERLAGGGANKIDIYAQAIKENSTLYRKARVAFRTQKGNEGKELEEVDEATRNNFLANEFRNSLSEEDKQTIFKSKSQLDQEYVKAMLGDDAEDRIKAIKSVSGKNFDSIGEFVDEADRMGLSVDEALDNYGLSNSAELKKKAEYDYAKRKYESERASTGAKFKNADKETQNKYLSGFSDELSRQAIDEYLNRSIVKNMGSADFDDIYQSARHENYGEESEVFKNVKKNIVGNLLNDDSEVETIKRGLSASDASVIEVARTDKSVIKHFGEGLKNTSDEDIARFLSNDRIKQDLSRIKQRAAENIFIEQTLGATFEGQDITQLTDEQRQTALSLAKRERITPSVDPSKMTGAEKRDYEYRRNLIQQEIRNDNNPQILANTFRNTTLINEASIVSGIIGGTTPDEIAKNKKELLQSNQEFVGKMYGLVLNSNSKDSSALKNAIVADYDSKTKGPKFDSLSISEKNNILREYMQNQDFIKNNKLTKVAERANNSVTSEISKYASKATTAELKASMTDEQIAEYLKSHENVKDQLISYASNDVTLAFDKNTQSSRKIEAVMNNTALQNKTLVSMMKDEFSEDQIKNMIDAMLKDRNYKGFNSRYASMGDIDKLKYINDNYNSLLTNVSKQTYLEYDKDGNASLRKTVNGKDTRSQMSDKINELSKSSKTYDKTVYREFTSAIDPARRSSDEAKANFFASSSESSSKQVESLQERFGSIRDTLSNFYKTNSKGETGFTGFYNIATSAIKNGVYKSKDGIVKFADGAFKGAIYKLTKKLPEASNKYDEWNANIQKQINSAKHGAGIFKDMSRSERESHVKELQTKIIRTSLPDNYYSMSNQEQINFRNAQNQLKKEALTTNFSKLIKSNQTYSGTRSNIARRFADGIGYSLGYVGRSASDGIKQRHKQDLADVNALIARYNATKVMRNKEVDFGVNFNNFANNYLTKNEFTYLDKTVAKQFLVKAKGQVDKNGKTINANSMPKFSEMTASQQKMMMGIREKAFAGMLNKKHYVLERKVKADNGELPLFADAASYGFDNTRYKNGAKKFTQQQSRLNTISEEYNKQYRENNGKVDPRLKRVYDKMYGSRNIENTVRNQNNLINLKTQYDKIIQFNGSFKGTKSEYREQLQKLLDNSDMVNGIYRRYGSLFGGDKGAFSLSNSPIAVQKNEIMNGLLRQMKNAERRVSGNYKGFIPASGQTNTEYVGKTYTNARKITEMQNNKRVAEELNSALKQFNLNSKSLSYDQLSSMLKPYMRDSFKASKSKEFIAYSDDMKKDMLRKHLENSLTKANNRVNNDSFFGSDKSKLEKLNGTYVERKVTNTSNGVRIVGNKIYQDLVQNYNNAKSKVDLEQINIDRMARALKEKTSGVQNAQTRREALALKQSLESARIRMKTYKTIYQDAESKKRNFEQAYATKRIEEAKTTTASYQFNAADVRDLFKKYRFPIKPEYMKPGPGGPGGPGPHEPRYVAPGSPEAKMIERAVGGFIMRYKNQLQMMMKSTMSKEINELNKYISNVAKNLSNDFARNVSDLRRTERKLKEELRNLEGKNDRKSLELKIQIQNNLQQMKSNEKNLINQLNSMGIDIKDITAINN